MKRITTLITLSICLFCAHFAYAQNNNSCAPACPPKECPKPCPPAPCPKPCPPKPCKPCPPVCFERGYPDEQCCLPSAYNEPASYELGPCPWDFWIDVSFTYWDAYQEGLDLGVNTTIIGGIGQSPINGTVLYQDTQFKPGFKVGVGIDLGMDHWNGLLEYTWFRSTTNTASTAPTDPRGGTPVWAFSAFMGNQNNNGATNLASKWNLNMDLLDAAVTRPYYQGTHLIIAPFGSLRGQWIRQNLQLSATGVTGNVTPGIDATGSNRSNSWAVGPRAGFQAEWHLGWGFRLEGDMAASLLFTRYTRVSHSVSPTTPGADEFSVSIRNYNCLRAGNDLNVGLGWGSYFDCRNYHFDLLATYDFQIFWNQNMMRDLADVTKVGAGFSPGNLYLQGLTLRAQFDF